MKEGPDGFEALQEAAKRETLGRKGKEAIVENYAKRHNMTIEEARKEFESKRDEALPKKSDSAKESFTVEEEPEPASPPGMTDEKFDKLDDEARIVVTAGMLRRFAHMIRAEERLKNKPITLNEMFQIAGEESA